MGEAKNKKAKLEAMSPIDRIAYELARKFSNDGQLIAMGWVLQAAALKLTPADPTYQEKRLIYMAGAEHVFSSMFAGMLDEERDETPEDLVRMSKLHDEILLIRQELKLRYEAAKGSA
jgi:hypothetical protein